MSIRNGVIFVAIVVLIGVYEISRADTTVAPTTVAGNSAANANAASGAYSNSNAGAVSGSNSNSGAVSGANSGGNTSTQGTSTTVTNETVIPAPLPRQTAGVCPPHYIPMFNIITGQVQTCVPMPKNMWQD